MGIHFNIYNKTKNLLYCYLDPISLNYDYEKETKKTKLVYTFLLVVSPKQFNFSKFSEV